MASKKYRKKLKRIHLIYNSKKNLKKSSLDFISEIEKFSKASEEASKLGNVLFEIQQEYY